MWEAGERKHFGSETQNVILKVRETCCHPLKSILLSVLKTIRGFIKNKIESLFASLFARLSVCLFLLHPTLHGHNVLTKSCLSSTYNESGVSLRCTEPRRAPAAAFVCQTVLLTLLLGNVNTTLYLPFLHRSFSSRYCSLDSSYVRTT